MRSVIFIFSPIFKLPFFPEVAKAFLETFARLSGLVNSVDTSAVISLETEASGNCSS